MLKIIRPVTLGNRMVRVVRRQLDLVLIDWIVGVFFERPMRFRKIDLRKEWLTFFALTPVGPVIRLFDIKVEISFAGLLPVQTCAIAGKISCCAEVIGNDLDRFRQRVTIVTVAAVMIHADTRLIHSCHKGRAAWRANWRGRARIGVKSAFAGELVNIRGLNK